MKRVDIISKIVGRDGQGKQVGGGISIPMGNYALKSDFESLKSMFNDFLKGDDTDSVINRWKDLEAFLNGISEENPLTSILGDYIPIKGYTDITGEKNFTGGLKVNGSPIYYDKDKKYWKLEGDLLVTGGVTMYGSDSESAPSILDSLPIASTSAKGIAQFSSAHFTVTDGIVSIIGSNVGLNQTELESYLTTNKYAKKSDIPTIPTSLKNPYSLTFGSKTYDGSAEQTIVASDLGALTSHQSIYALTIKNSEGTTQLAYTPNSAKGSLTLTKSMVGLGNVENTALSTWVGTNKITTLGTITTGTWNGSKISNDYLANNKVSISGVDVSLGGSITQSALRTALGLGSNAYSSTAYLPLTGGTLTGNTETPLILKGTYSDNVLLHLHNKSNIATSVGKYGAYTFLANYANGNGTGELEIHDDGRLTYATGGNNYSIWHEGNDGSGSGLNADLLDGKHLSDILASNVASATKIQTARKIWGNSFDGTSDINGQLNMPNNNAYACADTEGKNRAVMLLSKSNNLNIGYASAAAGYTTRLSGNIVDITYGMARTIGATLDSGGNFGIGTRTPSSKLHVIGDILATANITTNNTLTINGIVLSKSQDDVLYLDGNLVVRGGVTMYGSDSESAPSILDSLPIASTSAKGIAQFSSAHFTVTDGIVSIIGSNVGLNQTELESYLTTNKYAKKSDIPTIPTSLKNPYSLTFGSKTYDGSAEQTIVASDLGALTSHQSIYALTIKNSEGTTQLAYTPNSAKGSLTLTKSMVGLGNVENTALSTWVGTNKITTLGTITTGTWNGTKIANTYLANSAITISGTSVSLGGSITQTALRTALGLGSNAYSSTEYLPLTGNASSATKLATARTIWGQSFDGTGNVDGVIIVNGLEILYSNGSSTCYVGNKAVSTYVSGNSVNLRYGSSETIGLLLNSSGNVGIGTESPSQKLHVAGNILATGNATLNQLITTDPTGIRLSYGNYGTLLRSDGDNFYILLTNSGNALNGTWNDLRPFRISLSTGDITMESNLSVTKYFAIGSRFRVNSAESTNSFGFFKSNIANQSNIGIAHLGTNYGGSSDINRTDLDMTAISMYRGVVGIGKEYDYSSIRSIYDSGVNLGVPTGVLIGLSKLIYKDSILGISSETSIGQTLHVYSSGTNFTQGIRVYQNGTGYAGLMLGGADLTTTAGTTARSWFISTNNSDRFSISKGGFEPTDSIAFGYNGQWLVNGGDLVVSSNILATGGITMYSARKLKTIQDERGLSLEELSIIKPTRFTWKDGRDNRIHIGGIADDVMKVLPEVIYKTDNDTLTMDYGNAAFAIAASLIKPVVNHEERIKMLEGENERLKKEIEQLKWHIA